MNLTDTTDALVWATEFCRIFNGHTIIGEDYAAGGGGVPDRNVDVGGMLAWFASAIETGRSQGRRELCPHKFSQLAPDCWACLDCGIVTDEEPSQEEMPFVTYSMADGEPIWGEFSFVTTLDGFEEREDEVKLTKRTYRLVTEDEIILPDPYPIEEEDEDADDQPEAAG